MKITLVSVVIAVHNNEHSIGRCLECLLSQTYDNIEVVVIDDRSTDSSLEIVNSFSSKFNNFTIIKNDKQLFQGESLNRGIKAASGDVIQLLDSDYYLKREAMEKGVDYLINTPHIAVLSGSVWTLQKDYWTVLRHVSMLGGYQKSSIREVKTFSNNNAMIRKEVLNDCDMLYLPELKRSFDMEFSTRLNNKGYRFVYFPELKAVHDHPMDGWKDYVSYLRKEAEGYVLNRTLNPDIHYNFIKSKPLFYLLFPVLPFASTLKKLLNGSEARIYFYYPLIAPVLFIGQVYFWCLVSKRLQ